MSFIKKIGLVCFIVFCCAGCRSAGEKPVESAAAPRIINIINFIRQTDYRVENADSLLYETVCEQVKLVRFTGNLLIAVRCVDQPIVPRSVEK